MMKRNLCLFGFVFLPLALIAQNKFCGAVDFHDDSLNNPEFKRLALIRKTKEIQRADVPLSAFSGIPDTIPVVVHIIHTGTAVGSPDNPSDLTIASMIDIINQSCDATFPGYPTETTGGVNLGLYFKLAQTGPNCTTTSGIVRVDASNDQEYINNGVGYDSDTTTGIAHWKLAAKSYWNNSRYLNIWVVNKFDIAWLAGYAYYPTGVQTINDGIVILSSELSSPHVITHEIGHAFNLRHTFEGSSGTTCAVNTNCTLNGDKICDTDPHLQDIGCTPTATNICTNQPFGNIVYNYMNYSCHDRFTNGQQTVVRNALVTYRQSLLNSNTEWPVPASPEPPVISHNGPVIFCPGARVILSANISTGLQWYRNDTIINGATSVNYAATTVGVYTARVVNASGCSSVNSNSITITINTFPNTPSISAGGPTTFCQGNVELTSGVFRSYLWSNGDTTRSITVNSSGSYSVIGIDSNGCKSPSSSSIVVSVNMGDWIQKADFLGGERYAAFSFSIGEKGYVGTGTAIGSNKKDFWEFDPVSNSWTQKADFPGVARYGAVGFSIGTKGYAGTGYGGSAYRKDFWEYDPVSDTWTQKSDFPGAARSYAVAFSIGSKGYLGTGTDFSNKRDFWEYNPANDGWTQKADFSGIARSRAVGFSLGTKGYIGTGWNNSNRRDFWEYDPVSNSWAQKTDFPGTARAYATGFSIGNKGYLGTGTDGANNRDFWEYNPANNSWLRRADFISSKRSFVISFAIGEKGYLGTGHDGTFKKDFWEFSQPLDIIPIITPDRDTTFCQGESITLNSSPATSYLWSNNITTQSNSVSTSGNYSVTVIGDYGCTATSAVIRVVVLSNPTAPTIFGITQPSCSVDSGAIHIDGLPQDGNWALTQISNGINFSGNGTDTVLSGLYPGTYAYTVTNNAGCTSDTSIEVIVKPQPTVPLQPNVDINQPTCSFGRGEIKITAPLSDSLEYNIDGSLFQASPMFSDIEPGSHIILARRKADTTCISPIANATVNIQPSSPIEATTNINQPTCALPTARLIVTAPIGEYIYRIDSGLYQTSVIFENVSEGLHNIWVRQTIDSTCVSVTDITINAQPGALSEVETNIVHPTCLSVLGTVVVTNPIGEYEYSIDNGYYQATPSFEDVSPGTHYVLARRNNDSTCLSPLTEIFLNVPSTSSLAATTVINQPTCSQPTGTILVTDPLGEYEYSIDNGPYQPSIIFEGVSSGSHIILVRRTIDSTCISLPTTTVINVQPNPPDIATATIFQPTCSLVTGTIIITAPLGDNFEYNVDGGGYQQSTLFNGITSGSHNFLVRNITDTTCVSAALNVEIVPIIKPFIGADTILFLACPNSTIDLMSLYDTTGLNVEWDTINPDSVSEGTYMLVVTNNYQCTDTAFANIVLEIATWDGTESNDWHTAENWNINKVPGPLTHVIIPSGTLFSCVINSDNAEAASLKIGEGAIVQMNSARVLHLTQKCIMHSGN